MSSSAGAAPQPARAWRADLVDVSIPVCKPRLPRAERLLPYLREMDESRWYSNHGPLNRRLEVRLAEHAGAASGQTVLAANATAALTATLLALDRKPGSICLLPSWTFAASGHAVVGAGFTPWFVDVEAATGVLDPIAAMRAAAEAPGELGAVLVVAPFGKPVDTAGWEHFRRVAGVPVVLDAAAAFDTVRASTIPTVVSLHATKMVGVGEGAFIVWSDSNGVEAIRERTNFGFSGSREARFPALNAKLSEYAAAVGLAAFDEWPETRAAFHRVALDYVRAFDRCDAVALQPGYGTEWVSATTIVGVPRDRLAAVEDALARERVGTRRWWGDGLAKQRAFSAHATGALPVTDDLAARTLGLPCWSDLPSETAKHIAEIVCERARETTGARS
jgi:dTDP-4-amino-4,6-dideoxygalactose transaminase